MKKSVLKEILAKEDLEKIPIKETIKKPNPKPKKK